MVAATSTNSLGLLVWTLCIAVAFWLTQRFRNWLKIRRSTPGWRGIVAVLKTSLLDTLWDVGSTGVVVIVVWGVFIVRTVYDDHITLAAKVQHLQAFAKAESKYANELAQAQAKARQWQDAYTGVSKGEVVPDRILNREEMDRLHDELTKYARDSGNRKYSTAMIAPAFWRDQESAYLAAQLFRVFNGSKWNIRWEKETERSSVLQTAINMSPPVGVAIYTDDPHNQGLWIMWTLKDAGVDSYVATDTPSGFKGTLICVGYKQLFKPVQP